jgi:hypothetical protein
MLQPDGQVAAQAAVGRYRFRFGEGGLPADGRTGAAFAETAGCAGADNAVAGAGGGGNRVMAADGWAYAQSSSAATRLSRSLEVGQPVTTQSIFRPPRSQVAVTQKRDLRV